MSGRHAKPDRMWPPFAGLALVAAGIGTAVITGCVDAHGAPAPAKIEQSDAPVEQAASNTVDGVMDGAAPHMVRWRRGDAP
ncbi:hypothetical protein [Streptomyces sp. 769]|uniref:hypothetical protein n=1 Tax=Streptomyces sp. 769 TaxID=1262452 RepID=UPI00057F40DB|nr:hypothetical protein [Streptomyces sp. 769]